MNAGHGFLAVVAIACATVAGSLVFSSKAHTQSVAVESGDFPRRSELFQVITDKSSFRRSPVQGYYFRIAVDRYGRLPVVTQMLSGQQREDSRVARLQKKSGSTYYDYLIAKTAGLSGVEPVSVETINPGAMLVPGDYVLRVDDDNGSRFHQRVVMVGYWAMP
jgi:hypothetical protein